MPRPLRYPEEMKNRFPSDTLAAIDATGIERQAFVRAAVVEALKHIREINMHPTTFEYLKPTDEQMARMARLREAAKAYCDVLETEMPDGPDKTFVIRAHRSNAMWVNVAVTRQPDGAPRL